MPPKTTVGAPIKARLSKRYDPAQGGSLTETEASQARRIIKGLRRTDERGRNAAGRVTIPGAGRIPVNVCRGRVRVNDSPIERPVAAPTASVADTVCAAVAAGLFTASTDGENDAETASDWRDDRTDQSSRQSSQSESSQSESSQSDQSDGDGDDSDGESDGESDKGPSQSESSDGDGDGEDSDGEDSDQSESEDGDSEDGESESDGDGESESESENPPPDPEHDLDYLIRRLRELADYCESGESEVTDVVSNRAYIDGARMLRAGIPVRGILHAWAVNWPETARASVGIESYDPTEFGHRSDRHPLYAYVRALIQANVAVYLKGPTQAGKSYILQEVADDLGLPFRACPLIAGASSSWLLGAWTPEGFVEAGFPELYGGGGVFLFDEVDAADPNMITVLNNALSNSHLENPRKGIVIERHPEFRATLAANTWGTGATADHTGRTRLDKATLERSRLGRVEFGYDRELQARLAREHYGQESLDSDGDGAAELIEALRERLGVK